MKPSWLQCRKVTGAGTLGTPLPGSPSARGAGAARRALVTSLGGRGCRALATCSGGEYKSHFAASVTDPERFWGKAAEQISWYKPWTKTLESRYPPSTIVGSDPSACCVYATQAKVAQGQGDNRHLGSKDCSSGSFSYTYWQTLFSYLITGLRPMSFMSQQSFVLKAQCSYICHKYCPLIIFCLGNNSGVRERLQRVQRASMYHNTVLSYSNNTQSPIIEA
ncbi:Acss3 [Phodopus roborovskii]|uniref:Acss3 protein n=1 Tax=Phodopus roborovskii TaxID=109678 RepID=A0AAV0A9C7_PHORO|nr:Acss3 [Phodopus roborovskii]